MQKIRTVNGEVFEVKRNGVVSIVHLNNKSDEHPHGYYYIDFRDGHYALVNPEHVVEFWPTPKPYLEHTP